MVGSPLLLQWIHTHYLLAMFLLGLLAGLVILGSNVTGRGWFLSKDGLTYEGFKLEKIKPWTWLLISPVFVLGVIAWFLEKSVSGIHSGLSFANFYYDVLMPNCPLASWKYPGLYPFCGEQLVFVGIWMASIGYSLAPLVRKCSSRLLRSMRGASEMTIPVEESQKSLMKEKTELQ
jgi:hypothetical protein